MEQDSQNPILLLHDMDLRSRRAAHSLPQQIEVRTTWDGVAFKIEETLLVAPLAQVKEILTHVSISRIPGAKEWVKGVANVRGNLLPILDLKGFLSGTVSKMTKNSRILVIQHKGVNAGLIVDDVLGMRHFLEEEFNEDVSAIDASYRKLLSGSFRQVRERWAVFDIHKLVETPEFLQVAA